MQLKFDGNLQQQFKKISAKAGSKIVIHLSKIDRVDADNNLSCNNLSCANFQRTLKPKMSLVYIPDHVANMQLTC